MSILTFDDFAEITRQVIVDLDTITKNADPYPWFCKDIFRKKDLQWAGYLGPIGSERNAMAFGLNLEFTSAWRRIFPKIKSDIQYFSQLIGKYPNYEWHWWGRPGIIAKNPPREIITDPMWTNQVDFASWVNELEDILEKRKMWSQDVPMRPQIQIMRQVGLHNQILDSKLLSQNIKQIVEELGELVEFFR